MTYDVTYLAVAACVYRKPCPSWSRINRCVVDGADLLHLVRGQLIALVEKQDAKLFLVGERQTRGEPVKTICLMNSSAPPVRRDFCKNVSLMGRSSSIELTCLLLLDRQNFIVSRSCVGSTKTRSGHCRFVVIDGVADRTPNLRAS